MKCDTRPSLTADRVPRLLNATGAEAPRNDAMKPNRAAACRFFSNGHAVLMAMEAYAAAAHAVEPPPGECWLTPGGEPWANYTVWAEEFIQAMCDAVAAHALAHGIPFEPRSNYPGLWWGDGSSFDAPENAQFAIGDNRSNNAVSAGADNGR